MKIDHVTLRTADLEATRQFLEAVLGLKPGHRPAFSFPGYWLYEGDDPIVHLIPGGGRMTGHDAEIIDHAGFRLHDYHGTRTRLEARGIGYSTMDLPDLGERRLFVRTPGGILLELVFRTELPATA
ncbi:VOC family protein [Rhizobium sp. Root1220]|uniref:VOC family protein n=1 Tax=Rhizobium sp. Root1220 TaxID=1736432 RepID=UPI00070148F5|nr:VOC family protein [Rhizobium sp. Root1220]KQV80041.1 glyoxalase [Rhizobium sp. Root1220]